MMTPAIRAGVNICPAMSFATAVINSLSEGGVYSTSLPSAFAATRACKARS